MDNQKTEAIRHLLENEPDMQKRLALLAFDMHLAFNPYQAIKVWRATSAVAEKLANEPVVAAAHRLGVSAEELIGKAERTPEEEETIREVVEEAAEIHRLAFLRSRYGKALSILDAILPDAIPAGDDDAYSTQAMAVLCFFALHPDIDPNAEASLTSDEVKELVSLYDGLCEYMAEHRADTDHDGDHVIAFLNERSPAAVERVKAIRKGDPLEKIIYPLDKLNSYVWSFPGEIPPGLLPYKSEGRRSKKEVNILCGIEFNAFAQANGTTIAKTLSEYDKRVYIAIASLYDAGRDLISLQQIHESMGFEQRVSADQRAKISRAVEKMANIRITIDNSQEIAANFKYPKEEYRGPLLSVESIRQYAPNGSLKVEQFHILSEPRLLSFAKLRKQVEPIPMKVLVGGSSKTEGNLAIEHYLLERIAHLKKDRGQNKILYETICKHANVVSTKEKYRLPGKIKSCLDRFVNCGFIISYTESKDGVSIIVKNDSQQSS